MNPVDSDDLSRVLLGKDVAYVDTYSPELLCPIDRQLSRENLGIARGQLPFNGVDVWNSYELSWLNPKGKPQVACAEFRIPCESPCIIESKSFKLYLNSFNQTVFSDWQQVIDRLTKDLSGCAGRGVDVSLTSLQAPLSIDTLQGQCLDELDVSVDEYHPDPDLLSSDDRADKVEEVLYSHLLRSLCPVTGQPDWGSVIIRYAGAPIDHSGLLTYLIGYRQHQEFHEQCVERIYVDISTRCKPSRLSVYARYVRRGGLDINPFRSSEGDDIIQNIRLNRQ